jgi:hypothetical protein
MLTRIRSSTALRLTATLLLVAALYDHDELISSVAAAERLDLRPTPDEIDELWISTRFSYDLIEEVRNPSEPTGMAETLAKSRVPTRIEADRLASAAFFGRGVRDGRDGIRVTSLFRLGRDIPNFGKGGDLIWEARATRGDTIGLTWVSTTTGQVQIMPSAMSFSPTLTVDSTASNADEGILEKIVEVDSSQITPIEASQLGAEISKLLGYESPRYARGIRIDLNGDGTLDTLMAPPEVLCGTGGCGYTLLDGRTGRVLGNLNGTLYIHSRMINGWPVVTAYWRLGPQSGTYASLVFDGSRYAEISKVELEGRGRTKVFEELSRGLGIAQP